MTTARWAACLVALSTLIPAAPAVSTTLRRYRANVVGDFALIGNTLGHTCAAPAPVVGTVVGPCVERSRFADLSPDLWWRAETASASANAAVTPARMRSTSVLTLPPGAAVTRAYLYWWGEVDDVVPDTDVVLERPGVAQATFTATRSDTLVQVNVDATQPTYAETLDYLSVTDVTSFVIANGPGPYRVSGVGAHPLNDNFNIAYAGWAMVVIFERPGDARRNITLFDGIERATGSVVGVDLSGFLVPNAAFQGKLGVVGLDGELVGSQVRFGVAPLGAANVLSDAQNPSNRFFNGTRSFLGAAMSTPGDLPRTTGAANSLSGTDIDVVDVTGQLTPGQTTARAEVVAAANDGIQSLVWVIAVTTYVPELGDATKAVVDVGGGPLYEGDELEYTVRVHNRGDDAAVQAVMTDALPVGLDFVPGTLSLTSSAASGALTDAAGDDAGEYDAATRTLVVRLGHAASTTSGGEIPPGEGAVVRYRARPAMGTAGTTLANQAVIGAAGAGGSARAETRSDGDPMVLDDQPTVVSVVERPPVDAGVIEPDGGLLGEDAAAAAPDAAESAPDAAAAEDAAESAPDAAAAEDAAESAPDAAAAEDAAESAPDAAAAAPDAAASRSDAAVIAAGDAATADAGPPTEDSGCSCHGARDAPGSASSLAWGALTLALLHRARRRR